MKLIIYLAIISTIFTIVTSTNLKTDNRAKIEVSFSAANNIPESAKVMENIFFQKAIKVTSRFLNEGEENVNKNEQVNFGDQNVHRFKQNEKNELSHYEMKDLEAPMIRKPKTENLNIQQDSSNFNQNKLADFDQIFNFQNKLIDQFRDALQRTIYKKETEIVSVTKVQVQKGKQHNMEENNNMFASR